MAANRSSRRRIRPEKIRPSVYWILGGIVVPIMGYFAKIEIEGGEHIPTEGPFVVAPNHNSELDPLVVAVAVWRLGRAPRFMAKESLFHVPVFGLVMRRAGMVPVSRSSSAASARQTLVASAALVKEGRGVIVYPEGTLTRDPDLWPMRGKSGAVRLAVSSRLPVIPMAQWGVQEILPRYGRLRFFPPRKRVRIRIGAPVDLEEFYGRHSQPAVLTAATERIMDAITELLAQLRGAPAPETRWNPSEHGQRETGRLDS